MQQSMSAARLVRGLRARIGISQRKMAEVCQTQQPVISMIESDTPGKGMSTTIARRILDAFADKLLPDEAAFLGELLDGRTIRRNHVQIHLPDPGKAPRFMEFLIALSKATSDEMLSLTEQELTQWLYDHFFQEQPNDERE